MTQLPNIDSRTIEAVRMLLNQIEKPVRAKPKRETKEEGIQRMLNHPIFK